MGQIVFQATLGGQTALVGQNTASSYSLTLPLATDTLVGKATTDTLTNKTLTSPTITGGTSTATQNLANVTGTLAVGNGGTGATTLTGYVYGNGTGAMTASTTIPTSSLSGTINLATQVTGTLPVGNGGTGLSNLTSGYIPYGNGTSAFGSIANFTYDGSKLTITQNSEAIRLNGSAAYIQWRNAASTVQFGYIQHNGTDFYLVNAQNGSIPFYTNNTEAMRIDSSGNVGIGTSSPSFSLQVQKSGDSRIAIVSTSGSNTAVTQYSTNNGSTYWYNYYNGSSFIFQDNALERMRIDSSGNLGVGTTSPAALLDVWGSGKSILVGGTASNNIPAQLSTALYLSGAYDASNKRSYRMYVDGNGALNFDTTGSYAYANLPSSGTYANKMTLDTSGNLLVGQTSSGLQNSLSYALQTDGNFRISHTSGTASGSSYASFGYGAGTAIGSITQNGSTGVLYNLTSDYRLKNNPTALTGASEFIMALQPKTWDWWDGSGKGVGFIAHEFMEVAKYSGNGTKDEVDAEGKPKYQSIQPSSSEVMANLVALVQEQQVIIEQLKAKVGI
ncbi:MAG: tail fiber domain-containing protein [Methylococcales bacterium]|nr:MAG: tail fiber domain-containing protein [Methylococcales bacterium]